MPTPEQMQAAVHAYVEAFEKQDPAMAAALFADNAVVEDPIGSPPKVGQAAILEFYTQSMATGARLHLTGPIRVAAAHAAFAMQVRLNWDGKDMAIDVIDTFAFDDAGKVTLMQAYFGPGNMHA
ncbi:nuclear transport factor 2 family protein [Novosphingobium sp.]|uniref:nuclear transport factor 2 family protein n=1 Tax=Novosphingobium sp. TaxID=1874826 RepID=UPI0025FA0E07|nr:nuclear transport factor 2 family protein [Novosphingobium sp.]MCC6925699.1 nuclear transport factor 2 family protein [Novosphingobium sp.]